MVEKMKQVTFWLGVLGVLKLLLQAFGYEIPDEALNAVANGIAAAFGLFGVFNDHGKTPQAPAQGGDA